MKNRHFPLAVALLAVSTLVGTTAARACKYCWAAEAAGADYANQTTLPQDPTNAAPGTFPLDGAISQFKPSAAPVALATPPPAGSIVTSAADLRLTAAPVRASAPSAVPVVASVAHPTIAPARGSGHYADAGLLSLAAMGGVFCWRTRRKSGSDR